MSTEIVEIIQERLLFKTVTLEPGVDVEIFVTEDRSFNTVAAGNTIVEVLVEGPQGPSGSGGGVGAEAIMTQSSPSVDWVFNHNMGRYPDITVVIGGRTISGLEIYNVSVNQAIIHFSSPQAGIAQAQ